MDRINALTKIYEYMAEHKLSRYRMALKLKMSETALERFMKNKPSSPKTLDKIKRFMEDLECLV